MTPYEKCKCLSPSLYNCNACYAEQKHSLACTQCCNHLELIVNLKATLFLCRYYLQNNVRSTDVSGQNVLKQIKEILDE